MRLFGAYITETWLNSKNCKDRKLHKILQVDQTAKLKIRDIHSQKEGKFCIKYEIILVSQWCLTFSWGIWDYDDDKVHKIPLTSSDEHEHSPEETTVVMMVTLHTSSRWTAFSLLWSLWVRESRKQRIDKTMIFVRKTVLATARQAGWSWGNIFYVAEQILLNIRWRLKTRTYSVRQPWSTCKENGLSTNRLIHCAFVLFDEHNVIHSSFSLPQSLKLLHTSLCNNDTKSEWPWAKEDVMGVRGTGEVEEEE